MQLIKKITLLICITTISVSFAHNEWHSRFWPNVTNDPNEAVKWTSYSNIPLEPIFNEQTVPSNFDWEDILGDFNDACGEWEDVQDGCVTFQVDLSGIPVEFTIEEYIFLNNFYSPVNVPAFTLMHIDNINNIYLISESKMWLNNCPQFWGWTRMIQAGQGKFHFVQVFLHELGHIIGLEHCTASGNPIMQETIDAWAIPKIYLTSADETGLQQLCLVVDIEDYIFITLDYGYYNIQQIYVGAIHRTFVDEYPYGDYIVSWGNWKVEALHSCGKVLVYETSSGSLNIPSLPIGYQWLRDENGHVIAFISTSGIDNDGLTHYAEEITALGNVPNNFITSGSLTSNTIWNGCVTIDGNLTVPSGITLTINPNVEVKVLNNSTLTVYGTLSATNCEISADQSNWGSITFSGAGSSNSVLNNVTIRNGTGVRCLNDANVNITNSVIHNCTEGIYFYNSQPNIQNTQIIEPVQNGINGDASGMSPIILHNTITKTEGNPQYHEYQGIILGNNTNGYIAHNDISGFMWGMYIGGGSDAFFTNYSHQQFNPNNRVRDNSVGICAGWGGYIYGSLAKPVYGGNNSIYNNISWDAYAYNNSRAFTRYNWWGNDGAQTYADGTSVVDAGLPLSSDPWNQGPPPGEDGMNIISVNDDSRTNGDSFTPDSSILIGIYLEAEERILEAVLHYKQMVINNTYPGFAVRRLVGIKNRYQIHNIRDYLAVLLNGNQPYKPIIMTLFAGILLGEDRYEQAMLLFSKIINDYPGSYYAVNALFEKFFAALNYDNDRALAEQLLQELISLSLADEEYLMRLAIAENLFNTSGLDNFEKNSNTEKTADKSKDYETYSLSENYPNPFNPSTSIKYSLPEDSYVELKVYDILGREIVTLINEKQEAGNHNVQFDASTLPSGVYIYRIVSGRFIKSQKMILLK